MTETWRDVVGYEGRYQVSDFGRVKAVARTVSVFRMGREVKRCLAEKLLKPASMPSGHLQVALTKEGGMKTFWFMCWFCKPLLASVLDITSIGTVVTKMALRLITVFPICGGIPEAQMKPTRLFMVEAIVA